MSLQSVQNFFDQYGLSERIVLFDQTTATVDAAAQAHGVQPGQIAKTLALKFGERMALIVVAGNAKLVNKKCKQYFAAKASMLSLQEAQAYTGHEIGGICPFGLPPQVAVYLDISLQQYSQVIPAAGSPYASIRLTLDELVHYSGYIGWVDVCTTV